MGTPHLNSRTSVLQPIRTGHCSSDEVQPSAGGLHRTWAFRLAMLTWVASVTKAVGVLLHGLVSILPLFGLAALVSFFEGSAKVIFRNVLRNATRDWLMALLMVWYGFGVLLKLYFWESGKADWRDTMEPVLLGCAALMGFGFMHEHRCVRSFQIMLTLALGVQSLFSGRVMLHDPTLSREAWTELGGTWSYGDQAGFALQSILLPILVWRALAERGRLRGVLLGACAAIGFAVIVCQFQTAILLLALSIPTAAFLGAIFVRRQGFRVFAVVIVLFLVGISGFVLLRDSALMAPTVAKVERLWEDPTSGGYSARDARTASRWILAERSVASFCEGPLFGVGGGSMRFADSVGGHSSLFDMLGFYGLLGGGGAFIGLVLLMSARALQRLRAQANWWAVAVLTSVLLFLTAGVVNPYWERSIAFVLFTGALFRSNGETFGLRTRSFAGARQMSEAAQWK